MQIVINVIQKESTATSANNYLLIQTSVQFLQEHNRVQVLNVRYVITDNFIANNVLQHII